MARINSLLTYLLENFGPIIVFYAVFYAWSLKAAIASSVSIFGSRKIFPTLKKWGWLPAGEIAVS